MEVTADGNILLWGHQVTTHNAVVTIHKIGVQLTKAKTTRASSLVFLMMKKMKNVYTNFG